MDITYCKEGVRLYMVAGTGRQQTDQPSENEQLAFEEKMMESQDSGCLLDFHTRTINGNRKYYYDVTGLADVKSLIEKGGISLKELEEMIRSLSRICQDLDCLLLDENSLLMDPASIYLQPETGSLKLAYIPAYPGDFTAGLEAFARKLLGAVDYRDNRSVILAYDLCRCVSQPDFSVRTLESLPAGTGGAAEAADPVSAGRPEKEGVEKAAWESSEERGKSRPSPDSVTPVHQEPDLSEAGKEDPLSGLNDDGFSWPGGEASESRKNLLSFLPAGRKKEKEGKGWLLPALAGSVYLVLAVVLWRLGYLRRLSVLTGLAPSILLLALMGAGCLLTLVLVMLPGRLERGDDVPEAGASFTFTDLSRDDPEGGFAAPLAGGETVLLHPGLLPAARVLHLVSRQSPGEGDLYVSSFPSVVGSDKGQAGILLTSPGISRRHALIECRESSFYLADLHSRNGTYVNGKRLIPDRPVCLCQDDLVSFARSSYQVSLKDSGLDFSSSV